MPHPLHKSPTFWSGPIIIAFLCWAAHRSTPFADEWSRGLSPETCLRIASSDGALKIEHTRNHNNPTVRLGVPPGGTGEYRHDRPEMRVRCYFPAPWAGTRSYDFRANHFPPEFHGMSRQTTGLSFPYWLALAIIIPLWILPLRRGIRRNETANARTQAPSATSPAPRHLRLLHAARLLILISLIWAAIHSWSYRSGYHRPGTAGTVAAWTIELASERLELICARSPGPVSFRLPGSGFYHQPLTYPLARYSSYFFPLATNIFEIESVPGSGVHSSFTRYSLAFPVLILLHLALWSALIYYRHRRIKRNTTLPTTRLP